MNDCGWPGGDRDPGFTAAAPTLPAEVVETHISWVIFLGDHAYKLKKPLRTPFLDFSTVERRRLACAAEVDLNRRLAPDVYEGTATVLGTDGAVCDHLVVMRRLPADRRLAALAVRQDSAAAVCVGQVVSVLACFHAGARRSAIIDEAATAEALAANWAANTEELQPFAGTVLDADAIDEVDRLARRYLGGRRPLLEERIAAGRIVDGHGDLLADDVFCLLDAPRILDCLEFSDRLRHGDVLADVAFLAMDLERLGRLDLADLLLGSYQLASGDSWPASLAHLYIAYRAQVRAKVACLRAGQQDGGTSSAAARALLDLTLRHLRHAQVRLVLVGGSPGTGKTTLAAGLASQLGLEHLRSDVIRKELAGFAPTVAAAAPYGGGIYTPGMTEQTYQELLRRAAGRLSQGRSVVLDATWSSAGARADARQLAGEVGAELTEVCCAAPADVVAERVARRQSQGADASDAGPEIAAALAARAAPWPEATVVDTGTAVRAAVATAAGVVEPSSEQGGTQ